MNDERRGALTAGQRLILVLAPLLVRVLYATWRVHIVNDDGWRARRARGEVYIWSLWHGHMLPVLAQHRGEGAAVLISEHRDGELIARIVERLGLRTVRGSTSRGAARALVAMSRTLEQGRTVAITPDGPRGPAQSVAPGTLIAAQRSGVPIVAIGVWASRAWRLRSWDAFLIPKPFARVAIAYSDPVFVDATDARDAATHVAQFQAMMVETEARAQGVGATGLVQ